MSSPEPKPSNFLDVLFDTPLYVPLPAFHSGPELIRYGDNWQVKGDYLSNRECPCNDHLTTTWTASIQRDQIQEFLHEGTHHVRGTFRFIAQCTACSNNASTFYLRTVWKLGSVNQVVIIQNTKIGQYPKQTAKPATIFNRFLTTDERELLVRAILSRNASHGTAALTYLRKILEKKIEKIRIAASLKHPADEALKQLGIQRSFDTKIQGLRDHFEPLHREEVYPVFKSSYEAISGGIHAGEEEECCQIFDEYYEIYKEMYEVVENHEKSQKYRDKLKKVEGK